MRNFLEITLQNRKNLCAIIAQTSKEDLLKIPEPFRNNIWWNIAHVVVTQQLLMYKLSGTAMLIPDALVAKFKKGTVPDGTATEEEIATVTALATSTIEQAIKDYDAGVFANYSEYTTSANVTLKNIDDAIGFNLFHEGIHFGSILALKKML